MAEPHQQHYGYQQHHPIMDTTREQNGSRSTSKSLAVLTLFPISGVCLVIAGLILTGTVIGVTIATPLFVIFSPILVPALLTIGLAFTGVLTSGAFGITALSSLAYILNYFRGGGGWSA